MARNAGMDLAKGKYIYFLDSDDEITDYAIEHLVELAEKTNAEMVLGQSVCINEEEDWKRNYFPIKSEKNIIEYVKMVKQGAKQPVTYCENYVPWITKLKKLAREVDFISIHTYPVWEYKEIHEAMEYTSQNYFSVAELYPDKQVVITEAGWATSSNGRGINPDNVSEENQAVYYNDLMNWSRKEKIVTFVFEAFDEPWKGSPEPLEPEKHWGLFKVDRTPKLVMK